MLTKRSIAAVIPLSAVALFSYGCEEDIILTTCPGYNSIANSTVCDAATFTLVGGETTIIFEPKNKSSCYSTLTVKTDKAGRFALDRIMSGDYTVTFTNDEYGLKYSQDISVPEPTYGEKVQVEEKNNTGSETVENVAIDEQACDVGDDFKIHNECEGYYECINVRFCDQRTGLWVSGGEVSVQEKNTVTSTHTNEEGRAVIRVKNGPHTIEVTNKDYYKTYDINVTEGFAETIGEDECLPVGHGNVEGNICAWIDDSSSDYSGMYLNKAEVFVEMGNFYQSTLTDADGHYLLNGVPEGANIKVQAAKGRYTTSFEVPITANQTYSLTQPQCVDTSKVQVGVIANLHDKWGFVLDGLHLTEGPTYTKDSGWGNSETANTSGNITYIGKNGISCFDDKETNCSDLIQHFFIDKFLMVGERLNQFDVLYFSSGVYDRLAGAEKTVFENISHYLQKGGSIFVSDNGYELLRNYFNFLGIKYIDWLGDESKALAANQGYAIMKHKATIVDPDLVASFHGAESTLEIDANFVQESWTVMESNQPKAKILVKGTAPINGGGSSVNDAAMVVSVTPFEGGGKIIFSSIASNKVPTKVTADTIKLFQYLFFEL